MHRRLSHLHKTLLASFSIMVMLLTAAPASAAIATEAAGNAGNSTKVVVKGQVGKRLTLTMDQLRKFPQHSLTVTVPDPEYGPITHTVTGPLLLDVINAAGPRFDPDTQYDQLRFFVAVSTNTDRRAVFSWGELDPIWAGNEVVLALTLDNEPLDSTGVRLVPPADAERGRYISPVAEIYLGSVDRIVDRR